jgi:hypothetical protein
VCPSWLRKYFTIENLWVARVKKGYSVCVLGSIRGRVDVVKSILGIGLGAVLGKEIGLVVLEPVGRGLEEES